MSSLKPKQQIFVNEPPRNFPLKQNSGGRSAIMTMQIKKAEMDLVS